MSFQCCLRKSNRPSCPRAFYSTQQSHESRGPQDWVIKILIKASGGILKRNADNGPGSRPRAPRVKWARRNVAGGAGGKGRRERGQAGERQNGTELTGHEERGNPCRSLVYNRGIPRYPEEPKRGAAPRNGLVLLHLVKYPMRPRKPTIRCFRSTRCLLADTIRISAPSIGPSLTSNRFDRRNRIVFPKTSKSRYHLDLSAAAKNSGGRTAGLETTQEINRRTKALGKRVLSRFERSV